MFVISPTLLDCDILTFVPLVGCEASNSARLLWLTYSTLAGVGQRPAPLRHLDRSSVDLKRALGGSQS